ncbi:MAG: hypothetical protein HYT79_01395 [Elusimicrobia bacterium]|nr:hypothetical protein [Elusimicrobiota bacterium]
MIWLLAYNILVVLLLPLVAAVALFLPRLRLWFKEMAHPWILKQRLGLDGANSEASLWIHAASLGEARTLGPLLETIRRHPPLRVHMTVMTRAALDFALGAYKPKGLIDGASLMPLDIWPVARHFTAAMKEVKALLVMETELWPNFLAAAKKRGMKLILINGRMSEKTTRWMRFLPGAAHWLFGLFDCLCVSEDEYRRLLESFAPAGEVVVTGNLKWDTAGILQSTSASAQRGGLRRRLGLGSEALLWAAASTREGEEEIIINVFKKLAARHGHLRLALAPRHVERAGEVVDLIKGAGMRALMLSRLGEGAKDSAVAVVDEFGVLAALYEAADFVFVGGTFVAKIGGHNFLEPAALGKAVVIGPYYANFQAIADDFIKQGALARVNDAGELFETIERWSKGGEMRLAMGEKAAHLVAGRLGATQRTWAAIEPLLIPRQVKSRE